MTYWILKEVASGGHYLCGGTAGDSVWAPKRYEARKFKSRGAAQRFAAKENQLSGAYEVKIIKVGPKCTCKRCPVHRSSPVRSTDGGSK